jgi:hypothetical protein
VIAACHCAASSNSRKIFVGIAVGIVRLDLVSLIVKQRVASTFRVRPGTNSPANLIGAIVRSHADKEPIAIIERFRGSGPAF